MYTYQLYPKGLILVDYVLNVEVIKMDLLL